MSDFSCIVGIISLFGLPVGSLTVSDSINAYARGAEAASSTVLNGDTVPRLSLGLEWPVAELTIAYAPRLTLASIAGQGDPSLHVLHAGDAALRVEAGRYLFSLEQTASIGKLFLGNLVAPNVPRVDVNMSTMLVAPPTVTLLPRAQSVRIRSEQTNVRLSYQWSPRVTSTSATSYGILGGYGVRGRRLQPRQHQAQISQSIGYTVRSRHDLVTTGSGSYTDVSNGYEHWMASATEGWIARWSEATTTNLGLGVTWFRSNRPDGGVVIGIVPAVTAMLNYGSIVEGSQIDFQLGAVVTPITNRLTGELQTFAVSTMSISARRDLTSATLSANIAQTIPIRESGATRVLGAAVEFGQGIVSWFGLTLGARFQKQYMRGEEDPLPLQWVATAGVAIAPDSVHF